MIVPMIELCEIIMKFNYELIISYLFAQYVLLILSFWDKPFECLNYYTNISTGIIYVQNPINQQLF